MKDAGAYVKVDGIIIDDTKARTIALTDDVTTVEITSYAQDHKAVKHYSVQIMRGDATVPPPVIRCLSTPSTRTPSSRTALSTTLVPRATSSTVRS
ncbi:MAG: hypothetical protein ACLVEF_07245 [Bifidobacterium bifidum]